MHIFCTCVYFVKHTFAILILWYKWVKGENHCKMKAVITAKRWFKSQHTRTTSQGCYHVYLWGSAAQGWKQKHKQLALGFVLYLLLEQTEDGSTGVRVRGKEKSIKCWFLCLHSFIVGFSSTLLLNWLGNFPRIKKCQQRIIMKGNK